MHLAVGTRQAPLPQRLLGRDLFWWLTKTGLINKSVDTKVGKRASGRDDTLVGSSPRKAKRQGITMRPRATGASGRTVTFSDGTDLQVEGVVWATGFTSDYYYLAMQFIDGVDLERLVKRDGPLTIEEASSYVRQAALGLQHAAEQGLVHVGQAPAQQAGDEDEQGVPTDAPQRGSDCHGPPVPGRSIARVCWGSHREAARGQTIRQRDRVNRGAADVQARDEAKHANRRTAVRHRAGGSTLSSVTCCR